MRAMKDSGVEWIGEIPAEWTLVKVKRYFKYNKNIAGENADKYERLALTLNGVVKRSKNDNEGLQPEKFEGYQILNKNELVFKLIDLENVKTSRVGISPYVGLVSPAYIVLSNNLEDNRFYYYWFMFMYYNEVFNKLGGDGVRSSLSAKDLLSISIPSVNNDIRKCIADYLDKKCAEIDEIISKQHSIIEKLQEYKLSLITETVTKGLNADAEMKDSGIEWIGEIPKYWEIESFRHVLKERNEKNTPVKSKERLSLSIELGVTLYAEKTTNLDRFKDDYEQYKIAHVGDLVMNSMNMIVGASGVSKYYGCVSPAYYTFYDEESDHIKAKFCEYIFRSKTMRRVLFSLGKGIYAIVRGNDRVNTCRLKVSKDDLKNIKIPLPPVTEMRDIIHYIEQKSLKIENIIENKQYLINKLTEYKKSLIYEVVTGKKEV